MYQRLIVVGRAGKDAEMRYTPSGQAVTSFSVATTWKSGEKEETTWIKVTVWGKLAEVCNTYVKKGMLVLAEGRLTIDPATGGPRIWKNKNGDAAASFEMNANEIKFLSKVDAQIDTSAANQDTGEIPF